MATCCPWKIITWLIYTQQGGVQVQILRSWEYRGKADECHKHAHPQPQRYPHSQLQLFFTEVGTSVILGNQSHGITSQRKVHWPNGHGPGSTDTQNGFKWLNRPNAGCLEGHPWLQASWQDCPARTWHAVDLLGLSTFSSSPEGFWWSIRWWYAREKAGLEGQGLFIPSQALDEERGLCPGGKTVRKLKSCMENLARNKWEKLTWMITTCKCLKSGKNNQKGKEFMTHFPQSIQPPLAIYICQCLVLAKKWELSPSENQLHKHNEKLKQELHQWCISEKDTLMLWCCETASQGMFHHLGLSKVDWSKH